MSHSISAKESPSLPPEWSSVKRDEAECCDVLVSSSAALALPLALLLLVRVTGGVAKGLLEARVGLTTGTVGGGGWYECKGGRARAVRCEKEVSLLVGLPL
jgi:hypothetical protein